MRAAALTSAVLSEIAGDVVSLREEGWSVVVVTSGAITAGWADVGRRTAPTPRRSNSPSSLGRRTTTVDARVA